jgi:hypothetical protein
MLSTDGGAFYLLDFGLAVHTREERPNTAAGTLVRVVAPTCAQAGSRPGRHAEFGQERSGMPVVLDVRRTYQTGCFPLQSLTCVHVPQILLGFLVCCAVNC